MQMDFRVYQPIYFKNTLSSILILSTGLAIATTANLKVRVSRNWWQIQTVMYLQHK